MKQASAWPKGFFFALVGLLGSSSLSTPCWADIYGVVTDAVTHQAVGGAQISLANFAFCPVVPIATAVSAANGSYRLVVPIGSMGGSVSAIALGYGDYLLTPSSQGGDTRLNISMTPIAAIGGTIFGPDSKPVPNSVISVLDAATGDPAVVLESDDAGKFGFNGIAPGSYTVCVISSSDAYQDGCYNHQSVGADGIPHGTPFTVANKLVSGLDIHLQAGATISGKLLDRANNLPVFGYSELLFYTPAGVPVTRVDVWPDATTGAYQIPGLAPGNYYVAADQTFGPDTGYYPNLYGGADCDPGDQSGFPACSFTGVTPLSVPAQGLTNIDFDLSGGGVVTGRVVDASTGLGIPNAGVAACTAPDFFVTASTTTDASGNYVMTHVLQHFMVSTRAPEYMDRIWPQTLYDDVKCMSTDPQSLLSLPTPTSTLSGIDFSLTQGSHVSGVVSGTQETTAHVAFLWRETYPPTLSEVVAVNADGSFETNDLTTEKYPSDYTAVAWLDDGVTCVVYGGSPCGATWQASDPLSADLSSAQDFQAGLGTVILNLNFQVKADRVFQNGFE